MTAAATISAPRRSGRERKQVETIYSQAAKQEEIVRKNQSIKIKTVGAKKIISQSQLSRGGRKRKPSDNDASDDDDENDEAESMDNDEDEGGRSAHSLEAEEASSDSGDDDDDDDDDENFETKKRAATKSAAAIKNTVPSKKQGQKGRGAAIVARGQKTKVATGRSPGSKTMGGGKMKGVGMGGGTAKSTTQRSAHQALAILAKNVLPEGETPGLSSLVAGLLHSYRPTREEVDVGDLPHLSEYTPNLVALARKVIQVHNDHSNRAQLALLNLLFRSVGGGPQTDFSLGLKSTTSSRNKPKRNSNQGTITDDEEDNNSDMETADGKEDEEVILDDMDTDEWARVVTDLVDDMRHVPANQILICADPLGAVHQAYELNEREARGKNTNNGNTDHSKDAKKPPPVAVGAVEYRKIYNEFWYILGHIALIEGGMATTSSNDFGSTEKDNTPIVRLDAELVKNLILRIIELSPVGQPDVRAAATLAALSMAHAVLDQSAILAKKMEVASRQYAAAKKNKSPGGGGGTKVEALKVRIESLKRCVEDLEEVVLGPVVQGLFVHRYRDSNEHIRTMCISSLSRMSLQRPDIFLTDKYLKYFGWMMHDKDPLVRGAALDGLLKPFQAVQNTAEGKARPVGDENLMIEKIDLSTLEHVVAKFLPRIVDSVMDRVGSVQEVAMNLMLVLLKGGFLDEVNDDKLWDQTNQRCLAEDAPPNVRKNALYFIIEQLEAFDDGGENEKAAPNEHKRAQQLDAIASFAAHTLTNGPVPLDKIQVKVVDLLVKSLREMPEHRGLVTDWSAMLRAIKDDNAAATATLITAGDRANVAKQRLLVRMLACAAREEVGSVAETDFLNRGTDADTVERSSSTIPKVRGKQAPTGREHENLSIALIKALPNLLIQFKGDSAIIPELASLPRFLIPTVFSLSQRKQDFMSLIKNLGDIYLSSSDTRILDNTAQSIISLCDGDHARVADSKNQLRSIVIELRDRIVELMSSDDSTIATSAFSVGEPESDFTSVAKSKRRSARKKSQTSSPASDKTSLTDDDTKGTTDADAEYSIFLNLKRLKILSKKCDLSVFFDDRNNVNQLELLCHFVCDGLKSRLRACKPVDLRLNADEETTVHKVIDGPEALGAIGKSVSEGLEFVLCVVAWFANSVQVSESLIVGDVDLVSDMEEDDEEDCSVTDHVVIRLRNGLLSTLELCFAQYIPTSFDHGDGESTMVQHSEEQHSFSDFIQLTAGRVTSDLRTLFPKEYADASSPILRSFALQEDGRLIGAYVRFLDSKEHLLRDCESVTFSGERQLAQSLLFPMGRAVATNWTNGNRREAGVFLRHISESGPTAADIVLTTSRQMKKIDPVRMLESHMASLRQSYEHWVDDTPELDTDFPSEEEMAIFENEESVHKASFAKLESRASRFSQTLGVFGKLAPILGPALHGFIREGIRFSFSNLDEKGEDSLVLGSRLSFLLLLSKYATWVKKDKKHKSKIQEYVDGLESELRSHEEFEEVHADDLMSLVVFRQVLGLKALSNKSGRSSASTAGTSPDSDVDGEESLDNVSDLPSPVASTGGKSAGSRNSRSSRPSYTLPTLPEVDKEESPPDGDSDSDTISHFSGSKHSLSLMSSDQSIDRSGSSLPGSETSHQPKRRKK